MIIEGGKTYISCLFLLWAIESKSSLEGNRNYNESGQFHDYSAYAQSNFNYFWFDSVCDAFFSMECQSGGRVITDCKGWFFFHVLLILRMKMGI